MTKEILQPQKEVVKKNPFSRVALAGLAAVVLLTAAELTNKFVSAESLETGNICSVGVNIRGVEFVDIGGGRGIFDPSIDREVGISGNFTARAVALDRVTVLGETFVGANGAGFIRGINRPCNTVGPNGRQALNFLLGTVESGLYLPVVAEDGFAAKVVIGKSVGSGRGDLPGDRRDSDRDSDRNRDSDSDSNSDSSSSSRSESRSESSVTLPDRIKTEVINDPLRITGTVDLKDPLEIKGPVTVTLAAPIGQGITETTGSYIGVRPESPDLRNWRWWPWLIVPAAIAGGLAGLGAFLGGRSGRGAVAVHEDIHHTEGTRRTTTRRETRRTEGVTGGTAEGTRARATRETRETREETRETT